MDGNVSCPTIPTTYWHCWWYIIAYVQRRRNNTKMFETLAKYMYVTSTMRSLCLSFFELPIFFFFLWTKAAHYTNCATFILNNFFPLVLRLNFQRLNEWLYAFHWWQPQSSFFAEEDVILSDIISLNVNSLHIESNTETPTTTSKQNNTK